MAKKGPKKGYKMSEEAKAKAREALIRRWNDPVWSANRRKAMAIENSTRVCKPETRAKRRKNQLGRKQSDETKKKISIATAGENNPRYGKKWSDEQRKHLSEVNSKPLSPESLAKRREKTKGMPSAFKGHTHTPEAKEKLRASKLGKSLSDETRAKMSLAHKGNKSRTGMSNSPEVRAKISKSLMGNQRTLGHKASDETKAKIGSKSLGHTLSEESRKKISLAKTGPAHPRWRGGSKAYYGPGWKKCQRETRERDHSVCVLCGEPVSGDKEIDVHHVIKVYDCRLRGLEPHILANTACMCYKHHRWADDHDGSIPMLQEILSARFGYSYYQGIPSQIASLD